MPPRHDAQRRAAELYLRGRAAMDRGKPQDAVRLLTRARRAGRAPESTTDGAVLAARITITLANAEFELHGFGAAMDRLAEASGQVDDGDLGQLRISLGNQRGLFLLRTGRPADAVAAFDAALRHGDAAPPAQACMVLLNRAVARMDVADLQGSGRDLRACVDRARAAGEDLLELKAIHNLGYVEYLLGNIPAALALMDRAADLGPDVAPGIALLGKAEVLLTAGLVVEADAALARAAGIFRADRLSQDLAETELERARCALLSGDVAGGRRMAMRARDRFRRRGNERWLRTAELVVLQADLAAGRPGTRLTGPALRLRDQFRRDGIRLPAQTAALIATEAYLSAAQLDAARVVLADVGRVGRHDPITARLHHHYVRARIDEAGGRPGAASRRAGRALEDLAAYQAGFGSIDLATAAAVHGRRLAELDLTLAIRSGRPERVHTGIERARAVTSRFVPVRPPEDAETAQLLAELRQVSEAARSADRGEGDPEQLHRRRRVLEERISARGWTRGGRSQVRAPVSLDQVRGALGSATVVSFCQVGAALHAFVASRDRLGVVSLDAGATVRELVQRVRADLDVLADPRLPGAMRAAVTASLARSLTALDRALLAPIGITGRLVVVSTGVLGQLPWGLLPSLRGVPVVVAPSATAWHHAHTRPPDRRRTVVSVAGPGLSRSGEEARTVAGVWAGASVVEGADASGSALAAALARARVVHVAAHGVHQAENPLFSSIRMADGPLFAHELDTSAATPEHVVLSACELGRATVRPGDEALGLTSVLLHRGTRSVIAGVARVGDDVAAVAMAGYHARLAAGDDCATALASTLEDHREAPFVCSGAAFALRARG